LGEFLALLFFGFVLKCPVFIEKVAVSGGDGKRNGVLNEHIWSFSNAGQKHFQIENQKIEACINDSDHNKPGKLLDKRILFNKVPDKFLAHIFLFLFIF